MKKLLSVVIVFVSFITNTMGQTEWDTQIPKDCFCCNEKIYNLPVKPPIVGNTKLSCDSVGRFKTFVCPGATYQWTVTPSISFSGQGTANITINPPFNANQYTVSVTIKCGQKAVTNSIQFFVSSPQNNIPNYSATLIENNNGTYTVIANPQAGAGVNQWWILNEVASCPNGAVTNSNSGWNSSVSSTGTYYTSNPNISAAGTNGYGYNYAGLAQGKCYKLYHYTYACGKWQYQVKCFCFTPALFKVAPGKGNQKEMKIDINDQIELKEIKPEQLPEQIRKEAAERLGKRNNGLRSLEEGNQ